MSEEEAQLRSLIRDVAGSECVGTSWAGNSTPAKIVVLVARETWARVQEEAG